MGLCRVIGFNIKIMKMKNREKLKNKLIFMTSIIVKSHTSCYKKNRIHALYIHIIQYKKNSLIIIFNNMIYITLSSNLSNYYSTPDANVN